MRTSLVYRVIYGDTDAAGIVYHANYLRFFEAARCAFLRDRGLSYSALLEAGVHFPVIEAHLEYRRPARFEDELEVIATLSGRRRATLEFTYEIHRKSDDLLLALGSTVHACTGSAGRPMRIPKSLENALTL